MRFLFFPSLVLVMSLVACSSEFTRPEMETQHPDERRDQELGQFLGDPLTFGGPRKRGEEDTILGVNTHLWRASLDTISFMPLVSADPFGGVIITDWYSPPSIPKSALK